MKSWKQLKAEGVFPGKDKPAAKPKSKPAAKPKDKYEPIEYKGGLKTWQHLTWDERTTFMEQYFMCKSVSRVSKIFDISEHSGRRIKKLFFSEHWVPDKDFREIFRIIELKKMYKKRINSPKSNKLGRRRLLTDSQIEWIKKHHKTQRSLRKKIADFEDKWGHEISRTTWYKAVRGKYGIGKNGLTDAETAEACQKVWTWARNNARALAHEGELVDCVRPFSDTGFRREAGWIQASASEPPPKPKVVKRFQTFPFGRWDQEDVARKRRSGKDWNTILKEVFWSRGRPAPMRKMCEQMAKETWYDDYMKRKREYLKYTGWRICAQLRKHKITIVDLSNWIKKERKVWGLKTPQQS